MKKLFTLLVIVIFTLSVNAQPPNKMSYQSVVRNNSGALVTNQAVGMKISILQGSATGNIVFSETYSPNPQTNANGLVTVEIGSGTATVGSFSAINWSLGTYYLKTETDPSGGTNYSIVGTSQLLSVPYAMHAKTVETLAAESDPVFSASTASGITGGNTTNWNTAYGWGNHSGLYRPATWVPSWADVTGKPAFATVATSGSFADLLSKPTTLAGYGITDADNSNTNEIQTLSLSGTQLSLSLGGGTITLPSSGGFSLPYTGTTNQGAYAFRIDHTAASESSYAGIFSSSHGTGLLAESYGGAGLFGTSHVPGGVGVFGMATVQEGEAYGVYGTSESTSGTGVHGAVHTLEGVTYGVRGEVGSDAGYSGYFEGGRFYVEGNTGIGTDNPTALIHAQGVDIGQGNVVFAGQFKDSNPGNPPISGPGTRMMWYPDKGAFRAGQVTGEQWDMGNIGDNSIALGYNTVAFGIGCVALGYDTHAGGQTSTAMGISTEATGWGSTALGSNTIARSDYSTSIGAFNVDIGSSGEGEWIYTDPIFEIGIGTSESARANAMTVLKSGNVGIGTHTPAYKLDIEGQVNLNRGISSGAALRCNGSEALWYNGIYFSWGYGTTSTYNYFARKVAIGTNADPGTNLLVVNGSAAKPGGGTWATWSDSRLKDIHSNYEKGLNEIIALQPVSFSYRRKNPVNLPDNEVYAGLVAQEVQEVFPEAVTRGADGYLQLDIHPVNIALINAVKELKAENDKLKSENEQINSRLARLEKILFAVSLK